jgi:hypothetical protein
MSYEITAMQNILLALLLAGLSATVGPSSLQATSHSHDLSCEICQMKDANGGQCKGKVTRGTSSTSGVSYTCSNGHKFVVKSKIRVN